MKTGPHSLLLRSIRALLCAVLLVGGFADVGLAAAPKRPKPAPTVTPSPTPSVTPRAPIADGTLSVRKDKSAMDRALGSRFDAKPTLTESGLTTSHQASVLGRDRSLLQTTTTASPDYKTAESQVFVNGLQLVSLQIPLDVGLKVEYAVPPIDVKVTAVSVPVGPVTVNAKAGFSLSGKVLAELTPFLGIPLSESFVRAHVAPVVQSQAYVEGSVTLLVVRGGVGGAVTLVDADLQVYSELHFGQRSPVTTISGHLEFLSGKFYAFADAFNVFGWRWTNLIKVSLFEWAGHCYDFTESLEGLGKCASR